MQHNYFRCQTCGRLCDLDSNYCDVYHKWAHEAYKADFKQWLYRGVPLLDYVVTQEWEHDFSPIGEKNEN